MSKGDKDTRTPNLNKRRATLSNIRWGKPAEGFKQVGPGKQRKVYGIHR